MRQLKIEWLEILGQFLNIISSKEERVMQSKSENIEFIPYDNVNEVVNELFESLLWRYQLGLETWMKWNGFNFWFSSAVVLYMSQDKF